MGSFGASRSIQIAPTLRKAPSLAKLIIEDKHEEGGEEENILGSENIASGCGEGEFDFSEVFGPLTSHSPHPHPPPLPPLSTSIAEAGSCEIGPSLSPTWAIATGSQIPARILTRSHSLVGPSPRPNVSRKATSLQLADDCCPSNSLDSRQFPQHVNMNEESASNVALRISDDEVEEEEKEPPLVQPDLDPDHLPDAEPDSNSIKKLGPHDFKLLRIVGQGAFGKVFQVQEIETEDIFAMKVMRKDRIVERNHGEYMKAERDILTKIVHPFIVQLRYSFQTKSKLYLIFDFINGGHLFFQLYRQGTFSEELARVYTAEIVSAVAHLHKNGIIHRDLKPENILLDAEGHVKLTDFGLAKEIDDSKPTNSMCGTVEYMAPEIVLATGHGKAADWWSVGILLFEMLTGQPPFTHNNRQKLQQKIAKDKIKLPSYLTSEAHSLLKGLLQKEPSKRLGNGVSGSDDIKQHKWFKAINWKKLEAREVQPKFRPEVTGQDCIANFDERWTKMPAHDSPASTPKEDGMGLFEGYTYVAPNTWFTLIEKENIK